MEIQTPFDFKKYTFISRFDYLPGKQSLKGSYSKLYLLKDLQNKKYICKRVQKRYYNETEWKLIKDIQSEHILSFDDIYKEEFPDDPDNFYVYMITPYKDEIDLFTRLTEDSEWKERKVCTYLLEMSKALKVCHDHSIVHLDIKPENFVIVQENPLKMRLIDFGFSCLDKDVQLRSIFGTPGYVSPEVIKFRRYSTKSDVYSLGFTILFMIYPLVLLDVSEPYMKQRQHVQYFLYKVVPKNYSLTFQNLLINMLDINQGRRLSIDEVIQKVLLLLN